MRRRTRVEDCRRRSNDALNAQPFARTAQLETAARPEQLSALTKQLEE